MQICRSGSVRFTALDGAPSGIPLRPTRSLDRPPLFSLRPPTSGDSPRTPAYAAAIAWAPSIPLLCEAAPKPCTPCDWTAPLPSASLACGPEAMPTRSEAQGRSVVVFLRAILVRVVCTGWSSVDVGHWIRRIVIDRRFKMSAGMSTGAEEHYRFVDDHVLFESKACGQSPFDFRQVTATASPRENVNVGPVEIQADHGCAEDNDVDDDANGDPGRTDRPGQLAAGNEPGGDRSPTRGGQRSRRVSSAICRSRLPDVASHLARRASKAFNASVNRTCWSCSETLTASSASSFSLNSRW